MRNILIGLLIGVSITLGIGYLMQDTVVTTHQLERTK